MDRDIVFIRWIDAIGCSAGWSDDSTLEELDGSCETCGFLLDENSDFILVSGTVTDELTMGAVAIPKAMITSRTVLQRPVE